MELVHIIKASELNEVWNDGNGGFPVEFDYQGGHWMRCVAQPGVNFRTNEVEYVLYYDMKSNQGMKIYNDQTKEKGEEVTSSPRRNKMSIETRVQELLGRRGGANGKAFTVFHKNPEGRFFPVATVHAKDEEEVFALTQNVESNWTSNPNIKCFWDTRLRSTSVGDLYIREDGVVFTVEPYGHKKIETSEQREREIKNNSTIFDFPLDFSTNVYYNIYVGNKIPN